MAAPCHALYSPEGGAVMSMIAGRVCALPGSQPWLLRSEIGFAGSPAKAGACSNSGFPGSVPVVRAWQTVSRLNSGAKVAGGMQIRADAVGGGTLLTSGRGVAIEIQMRETEGSRNTRCAPVPSAVRSDAEDGSVSLVERFECLLKPEDVSECAANGGPEGISHRRRRSGMREETREAEKFRDEIFGCDDGERREGPRAFGPLCEADIITNTERPGIDSQGKPPDAVAEFQGSRWLEHAHLDEAAVSTRLTDGNWEDSVGLQEFRTTWDGAESRLSLAGPLRISVGKSASALSGFDDNRCQGRLDSWEDAAAPLGTEVVKREGRTGTDGTVVECMDLVKELKVDAQNRVRSTEWQSEVGSSRRRKSLWKPRTPEELKQRIAIEQGMKRAGDKPSTPLVRALTWGLRGAETVEEVGTVLDGLDLRIELCSSVIQKLGLEGQVGAALAFFNWLQREAAGKKECLKSVSGHPEHSQEGASSLLERQETLFTHSDSNGTAFAGHLDHACTGSGEACCSDRLKGRLDGIVTLTNEQFPAQASYIEDKSQHRGEEQHLGAAVKRCQPGTLQPNVYIYNSLLGALKANKEFGMISEVMSWMEEAGIAPDTVTYNTLISLCEQRGDCEGAFRVFETMKSSQVKPNLFTFRNLINICKQRNQLERALDIYKTLLFANLELNSQRERAQLEETEVVMRRMCNEEMRRRLQSRDNGQALDSMNVLLVFWRMEDAKIRPDRESYSQALWACCRYPVTLQRTARTLFAEMYERNLTPAAALCSELIRALGQAKKWWAALEVFQRMQAKGPPPTEESRRELLAQFNKLLLSARKRRLWKWALQLLERMENAGLEPDTKAWATAVATCAMASQTEAAMGAFRGMMERGHKPGIVTYGALLSALEKGDLLETALEVWEHMTRVGIEPNLQAYTTLVVAYGRRGEYGEAVRVFEEMRASGCSVDVVAYNAILTTCACTGQGLRALEWLQQMRHAQVQPNAVSFEQAIEALANEGHWEAAAEAYNRARSEGVQPTPASYDSVVRACLANGASVKAVLLGPRPLSRTDGLRAKAPSCKVVVKTAVGNLGAR